MRDIEHLKEGWLGLFGGKRAEQLEHSCALGAGHRQRALAIAADCTAAPFALGPVVEMRFVAALRLRLEELLDEALCRVALQPPRTATGQGGGIGLEETLAQPSRSAGTGFEVLRGQQNTGQESHQIPAGRRQRRLIEIVDVEMDQPVVGFVAAEILQVQVAADPDQRRRAEQAPGRQALVEQVAGTAQEYERALAQVGVLHRQTLRVASAIETSD